MQIQQEQKKAQHAALINDLSKLTESHESQLAEVAAKHSQKVQYIHKLLHTSATFKQKRQPSLMNVIIHHKAQQLNNSMFPSLFCIYLFMGATDIDTSNKKKVQDIHEAAKSDPELNPKSMSKDKKKELIDSLIEYWACQSHGIHISNLTATQDTAHTIQHIKQGVRVPLSCVQPLI